MLMITDTMNVRIGVPLANWLATGMDIKPPTPKQDLQKPVQGYTGLYKSAVSSADQQVNSTNKKHHKRVISFKIRSPKQLTKAIDTYTSWSVLQRVYCGLIAFVILSVTFYAVFDSRQKIDAYALGAASKLLKAPIDSYADKLQLNKEGSKFQYNLDYQPSSDVAGQSSVPKFSADFATDPKDGVNITDPVNKVTMTMKPDYKVAAPLKENNRLVYPIANKNAKKVYSLGASYVKEDILLNKYINNEMTFKYTLDLPDELEARMEADGSVGIYAPSNTALLGQVSTGSDKDAELLQKARKSAEKNMLVFGMPAPFIVEAKGSSQAKAWYSLKNNQLTIHATGLKNATYPLSIDPSVYIDTASKLMRGNNESNVDFDVDNELIQKGKTTGARFDSWTSTTALPTALWNQGTVVMGGYMYVVGGSTGSGAEGAVYWSKLNSTTGAIEAPNPGTGACANWCTSSVYDLPSNRKAASVVAYNGYIYLMGGIGGAGSRQQDVYIAKIGANGEPSLWHPTDTNKSNWLYWYKDTNLSSERSYSAAAAYNNRMYLIGGSTNASSGGVTTVEKADISPTGVLTGWTTTGMTQLSSGAAARHSHSVEVYNDRMYVIGGNNGGTLQSTAYYIKINSDGTTTGNWQAASSFSTARMTWGGKYTTIWGGYLYLGSGCTAINGSGYCTTIASDMQIASINADGSLADWQSLGSGANSSRIGYGLAAWRDTIYGIGGCTAHNTSTGNCTTTATLTQYGDILQDGEASTVRSSVASGVSPCVSTTWTNCDMPPLGNGNGQGGQLAGGSIINNGFIYYIGGCFSVGNNSVCFTGNSGKTSDTISYSAIASDGTLVRSASCVGSYYGSWCVDNTNTINGSNGLAAFGHTIFNNVIYAIGGTDGTQWQATVWRNPLNADGSLGTWSTQTFANLDLGNAKGYQYSFTRANPSSAGTYPGNLYVIGGCSGVTATDNGLDCTGNTYTEVYKCNILTTGALEEADANDCTTTGQVQLDAETGTGGSQGLGVMAGTVYANYVYLIGGQSPNETERGQVMYAKIDNSNNIVDVDGETANDDIWETSPNEIDPVRRRSIAFGYNGYLYALAGYNTSGGGSLNDLLFAKIDVSDGSIGEFVQSTVTVTARWDLRAVVNNGYVYTLGGCSVGTPPASCTTTTSTIQTFQLYNNYSGSPKAYSASSNLFTTDRIGSSATVLNGYMYVAGGCTSATDCTTASTSVQYASIGNDGALGTWNATTASLPAVRAWGQLEAAGGTLYYIGGQNSTATNEQSTVYYGTPASGDVTTWSTASNGLPSERTKHSATVWNNRIYVVGGLDNSATATTTVYISPQLNSGGNITSGWSTSTAFNVARSGTTAVAYANNLYLFGGYTGSQYLNDAQYSKIDSSNGTVGSWTHTTSLPGKMSQGDGFAVNGFMYLFGGRSADTTCESKTIVAPISANTTIASGNNPTGVGQWFETNVKYTGNRYGASAVYYEGKAYLLGGGCGATVTYTGANRVVSSTLQTQPQITRYSRFIDTDSNVFPNSYLMNGLDNSIGAQWRASYRSAVDSANVVHHQSFDDGTNGNAVTAGNSNYDLCYANNSATNTYSNSQYVTPNLSMRIATSGGSGDGGCLDSFDISTVRYERFYIYFDAFAGLSANTVLVTYANDSISSEVISQLQITTAGQLRLRDKVTAVYTSAAIAANTWHRVEIAMVNDQMSLRTFEGSNLNGTTPTQSTTVNLNNATRDDFDRMSIGLVTSVASGYGIYLDDHKASASTWVGPAYPGWGQNTDSGNVTLGDVMPYVPKDSAGANTSFARWYYFNLVIDSQFAYGYPDDITRGPTLADLSLFFTADPNKRLRHGKTFTGGEKQPLDTPCRQSNDADCPLP